MDLVEVFYASASARWEVYDFHVFRHPRNSRKFITHIGAGCSCYEFEPPTRAEAEAMTPLGKREVYAAFSKWWDSAPPADHSGTKVDNLQRLRDSL